jgi:hypothetical protein
LFVSRSYDLKRLYHHPELAVAYGSDLRDAGTLRLTGDVVAHAFRGKSEQGNGLAVYALLYDGGFVDNPYIFQLRTAAELLFSPRRPMTILFRRRSDGARRFPTRRCRGHADSHGGDSQLPVTTHVGASCPVSGAARARGRVIW